MNNLIWMVICILGSFIHTLTQNIEKIEVTWQELVNSFHFCGTDSKDRTISYNIIENKLLRVARKKIPWFKSTNPSTLSK